MKPHVIALAELPPAILDTLNGDVVIHNLWSAKDKAGLLTSLRDEARGILTTWQKGFDGDVIRALPRLEVISVYGTGEQSNFDLGAARERGVVVTNTAADGTDACVADLTVGLLLGLARRISDADRFVRAGEWPGRRFPLSVNVSGKRAGILGLGYIGRQIARRLEGFDMKIGYCNTSRLNSGDYVFYRTPAELAANSDFLIVSCRGGPETTGLINGDVLTALGPSGLYIHTAQARIYDEKALLDALRERRIAGAAIDTFDDEPSVNPDFFKLDNVLLSPHAGASTGELIRRRCEIAAENLKAHFAGTPLSSRIA